MLEDLKWYKQPRRSFQLINGQSCSSGWFQYFKYNYNLHPNVCSNSCEGWVEPKPRQMKYRLFAGVFFGAISRTSFWASFAFELSMRLQIRLLTFIPKKSNEPQLLLSAKALCIRPERLF